MQEKLDEISVLGRNIKKNPTILISILENATTPEQVDVLRRMISAAAILR